MTSALAGAGDATGAEGDARTDAVRRAVGAVIDPELRRPLAELDMIRSVGVSGARARVEIALTIVGCPAADRIERDVRAAASTAPGVSDVEVVVGVMSPPERQALYKNIKLADGGARVEYVFEPAFIERTVEKPIYGPPDENGNLTVSRVEYETVSEPTELDIDEFIAMMWVKGVRAGLDITLPVLTDRVEELPSVAVMREPQPQAATGQAAWAAKAARDGGFSARRSAMVILDKASVAASSAAVRALATWRGICSLIGQPLAPAGGEPMWAQPFTAFST